MNIDVIMLAYSKDDKTKQMTANAIKSLHDSSTEHTFKVYLIETSKDTITYDGAEVIHGIVPFNYNRNLNLGLSKCIADWVVIANNDLLFSKDWINPILAADFDSASPISPGWGPHKGLEDKITKGFRTSIEMAGWCIVAKKATLVGIGGFDEAFDLFHQDNDYALQLTKHGYMHALIGTSQVTHLVAQSHDGYEDKKTQALMRRSHKALLAKYANPTICLTMIVKDEAKIITDMLKSVSPFIHYWSIVDTGSTDGTQQIIKDFFATQNIPGELHERPWVNFGHNRTESMQLAEGKADYLWVMDADDSIVGNPNFKELIADGYTMRIGKAFSHWRQQLFRSGLKWSYKGVLHEYAYSDAARHIQRLEGDYHLVARCAGTRNSDPLKYQKDAVVLEEALKTEPDNSRYWFYLGQSYFDCQNFKESKRCYEKRVAMGGWQEECFYAQWRVGLCAIKLNESEEVVRDALLKAYEIRPCRAESLHNLAEYYRFKNRFALGYLFAKQAAQMPFPQQDVLFIFKDIYDYRALLEVAVNAFYLGKFRECYDLSNHIIDRKLCPPEQMGLMVSNRKLAAEKLGIKI